MRRLLGFVLAAVVLTQPFSRVAATEAGSAMPKVGDMAPDFTLQDQNGKKVSLRDFRGKQNVALAFYIFAFTGG